MLIDVHLFRHGETDWNAEGRFQGHLDIPMNARGRAQARELVPLLTVTRIEAILCSDLHRARETAEIVSAGLGGVPIHLDAGLREANLGLAQGLTAEEIRLKFGEGHLKRWASSHPTDADVAYDGGESGTEVMTRAFEAMERFIDRSPGLTRIGVSTHGGVLRRIMQRILPPGSPPVRIPNCVLYTVRFERTTRKWILPGELVEGSES